MIKTTLTTSALFAASLFTASINAANISYNTSVSLSSGAGFIAGDTNYWLAIDTFSLSNLQQFDPASGVLTSATITIGGNLNYSIDVWGDAITDEAAPHSIDINSSVGVGAAVLVDGSYTLKPYDILTDAVSCAGEAYSEGACTDMIGGGGSIATSGVFTGSGLTAFVGNGSLSDIDIHLLAGLDTFTFENVDSPGVYIEADFTGDITVNYEYSVVPVPAAVWLFGSGLIGLIGVARRKKL